MVNDETEVWLDFHGEFRAKRAGNSDCAIRSGCRANARSCSTTEGDNPTRSRRWNRRAKLACLPLDIKKFA